ncbi:hypothetical protein ISG33_14520 [Glaciecola sp. MH2013]|uniref:hypothetical protein n=1 Tax=Glaciecola sp. MH2013 TaxID=2785524 RepID=UPI0018A0C03C|nr:hypothetical protein [Glaciecola sp. MH2013]MBF7074617.1 hypothetical protein [Glaciecola sp. MH2013]
MKILLVTEIESETYLVARPLKSHFHLFLMSYFRVREHSLFGLRWSTSVVVSAQNEYCFT